MTKTINFQYVFSTLRWDEIELQQIYSTINK